MLRTRNGSPSDLAVADIDALRDLAGRSADHLHRLDVPPEGAVIGIYRSFGPPGRTT